MSEIISALWPVFALLLLGYLARSVQFPGDTFWPLMERLIYFVFFPVLLVDRLAQADMGGVPLDKVLWAVLLLIGGGSLLAFLVRPLLRLEHAVFTSFYQGSVRFNTYVGLAATAALFSDRHVAIAAVVIALLIPLLNVACVLVFALRSRQAFSPGGVCRNILHNPLILACVLGLILNLSGWGLPAAVASVTELLSRVALPMGLLAVGAGLSFRVLLNGRVTMLLSSAIKLLLMPLLAVLIGWALNLGADLMQVFVLFAALPTATSAYILARQLGGDAEEMAAIITGQTLLAMLTLPIVLTIFVNFS